MRILLIISTLVILFNWPSYSAEPCESQCKHEEKICLDPVPSLQAKGCYSPFSAKCVYRWIADESCTKSYSPCLAHCETQIIEDKEDPLVLNGKNYGVSKDRINSAVTETGFVATGGYYLKDSYAKGLERVPVDLEALRKKFTAQGWNDYQAYLEQIMPHAHGMQWKLSLYEPFHYNTMDDGLLSFSSNCFALASSGDVGNAGGDCSISATFSVNPDTLEFKFSSWKFEYPLARAPNHMNPVLPPPLTTIPHELAFLEKIASENDVLAEYTLGNIFLYGYGVPADIEESLKWLRMAKHNKYDLADQTIGWTYKTHWFKNHNSAEAAEDLKTLRKSAETGDMRAQMQLAEIYSKGNSVTPDYTEVRKWLNLAAEQGVSGAREWLGRMYAHGEGVQQSYAEAYFWYLLTSEKFLERDTLAVAQHLTEPEMTSVKARVAAWLKSHPMNTNSPH